MYEHEVKSNVMGTVTSSCIISYGYTRSVGVGTVFLLPVGIILNSLGFCKVSMHRLLV